MQVYQEGSGGTVKKPASYKPPVTNSSPPPKAPPSKLKEVYKDLHKPVVVPKPTPPRAQQPSSAKTQAVAQKAPAKTTPKPVPKTPAPKPVAKAAAPKPAAKAAAPVVTKTSSTSMPEKPTFDKQEPGNLGLFYFEPAPSRNWVSIPQPPPVPGPEPQFKKKFQQTVTKFEYLYGIKHLELKHLQYSDKSVYVSKPINVAGNVMSVTLHSIEEHPLFDELSGSAANRQTSIEYYIAPTGVNPSPTLDDWSPILPEDVKTVKSELLIFATEHTAELRFPALIGSKETPVVYKNGLKMENDEWSFANGGTSLQLFVAKDQRAIYTIDYTPNAEFYNPWVIDVHQNSGKPIKHTQLFPLGTNHNKTVVLEKYPYVNYETINKTDGYEPNSDSYVPIKVTLQDAGIIGPNRITYKSVAPYDGTGTQQVYTKNVTNYKTGIEEELKPYSIDPDSIYNGFEYRHEKDRLYFSETFNKANIYTNTEESHGNATIAVEYEYLSSDFRVKIIMRRNSTDENTLTPIVHEYALKFKVMK